MSRQPDINRRDFMTGAFRGRNAALAATAARASTEAPKCSRDSEVPMCAPDVPEWGDRGLRKVLESMNDLSGIEEP